MEGALKEYLSDWVPVIAVIGLALILIALGVGANIFAHSQVIDDRRLVSSLSWVRYY